MNAENRDSGIEAAGGSSASGNEPKILDHEYDGIQEFDNPTPGWWHMIFYASVLFSVFYFIFFEWSSMRWSVHDTWKSAQVAEFKRVFGKEGELNPDEPTIIRMMGRPDMLAIAEGIFQGNCASCHAKDGGAAGGMAGVNLTDDHYKNVKQLTDLYTIIAKGANNGAMPAWENRLSKNERIIVAAYAASLRGKTSAPGSKGPEGEKIAPWPTK
jgi:cytochrome c oxidase cbb3-type subunit III